MQQAIYFLLFLVSNVILCSPSLDEPKDRENNIQDWLSLYNKLQDDYFLKKGRVQHRHFLPRTYFYIPDSLKQQNREPDFNSDFFTNDKLDQNGLYILRSNQFGHPQYVKIRKSKEDIQKLVKQANEKNKIVMIQKYVDEEINIFQLQEETNIIINNENKNQNNNENENNNINENNNNTNEIDNNNKMNENNNNKMNENNNNKMNENNNNNKMNENNNNNINNNDENRNSKYFVNCKYVNGLLFTDINRQELMQMKQLEQLNQVNAVIQRIMAIQQQIAKMIINNSELEEEKKNIIITVQLGFVQYDNQIKPFLKNILPVMEYTKKQHDEDLIEKRLTIINMDKLFCKNDRHFKLFKYDYDYRLKRVHILCNREFIFHHDYFQHHTDQFHVLPPHCRNLTWTKQEKTLSLKQSDIVFRRGLNKDLLFKRNVTQISYLLSSWVIDLKNTFAFLIKKFDADKIVSNYRGLNQIPETFEINLSSSFVSEEEGTFLYDTKKEDMWISKPINNIGGKGIQIYRDNVAFIRQILQIKANSHLRNRYERLRLGLYWREHWITLLKKQVVKPKSYLSVYKFKSMLQLSKQTAQTQDIHYFIDQLQATSQKVIDGQNNQRNDKDSQNNQKKEQKKKNIKEQKIIIQRYIKNPLLLNGRKFDLRSYIIVASADPLIVLFRHGYVRLTYNKYDKDDADLMTHLVNTHIQKRHPLYQVDKDDSHWNMHKFEQVIREEHKLRLTAVQEKLYKKMKQMLTYIFLGSKDIIGRQEGLFQIFGTDYMFDEHLNPYLIEINDFPWLQGGTSTHEQVCKDTVYDFLELSLYANSQIVKGEHIDIQTLLSKCSTCELLINETNNYHLLQDLD